MLIIIMFINWVKIKMWSRQTPDKAMPTPQWAESFLLGSKDFSLTWASCWQQWVYNKVVQLGSATLGQWLSQHWYNSLLWSVSDVLDLPLHLGVILKECYFCFLFTLKIQWSLSSKRADIRKLQYAAFMYIGASHVFASAMSCSNRQVFQQQHKKRKNLAKLERDLCLQIADL